MVKMLNMVILKKIHEIKGKKDINGSCCGISKNKDSSALKVTKISLSIIKVKLLVAQEVLQ